MSIATTRRRSGLFLGAAGAVAALVLTACAGTAGDAAQESLGENRSGASTDLLTFTGSGGVTQAAMETASIKPFAAKYGIKVTEDEPVEIAKLKVMVESGNVTWDVLHTSPYLVDPNCGTLFEPIDKSIVDTSKLPPNLTSECGVPIVMSGCVLYYNADKYTGDVPKTWADFFDTKKFPGKRGISKAPQYGPVEAALLADGVSPSDLYPLDADRAFKKLDTISSDLVYWGTGAQQQQLVETGEVDMIIGWPGRVYAAVKNGANFEPVWGAAVYLPDVLAVPKGSPNKENAMKYINFAIEAGPQADFANLLPYAAVNKDVAPPTDPLIDKFAATQQKIAEFHVPALNTKWWSDNMDDMTKRWTGWVTG